ncbi:MAG TPA: hypothetical protein VHD90_06275 [Phototrophicaceae bacterium]|nr:hypothetical protein [Phototrophicaceae bacterium]
MSQRTLLPSITSWTLWRRLLDPPIDPVYERTLRTRPSSYPISAIAWGALIFSLLTCCGLWSLLIPLRSSLAVLLLIVIMAATTFYVAAWLIQMAAALARERTRSVYDLLCVTPPGTLGITWAISAACLHSDDALGWIDASRKVLTAMTVFTLTVIVVTISLRDTMPTVFSILQLALDIAIVTAVSYADHVQSVVLGSLIAMLAPTYVRGSIDAQVLALFVFLTLQVAACLPTVLIVIGLGTSDPLFLSLLALCGVREGVIAALWRLLTVRLNAAPLELTTK